ncbi:MAG: PHP domain-containing protein [Nostocoides sp.]
MIDLHTHSTASDGTDSPTELVHAAADAGITTLAITDHDSTRGWDDAARAAERRGITLVRGIEMSTTSGGISIHLLAYLPDPDDPDLLAELRHTRDSRATRLVTMVELMERAGVPITYADVLAQVHGDDATVGRPHIADALVAAGVVPTRDAAFAGYLSGQGAFFVPHYATDVLDAVRLVRRAGGVPVMAHPLAAARGRVVPDEVIEAMADAGLAGIEAFHRDHTPAHLAHALDLAEHLQLLVTGSSDYHGTGKANVLGEHTTDPTVLEQIEAQASAAGGLPVLRFAG